MQKNTYDKRGVLIRLEHQISDTRKKKSGESRKRPDGPAPQVSALLSIIPIPMLLEVHEQRFRDSGNPLELIEAFCLAHAAKLLPPPWVLDSLAKIFGKFQKARGTESLDDLLGFNRGRRMDSWFMSRKSVHMAAAVTMFNLMCVFELTRKQAARMVAAKRKADLASGRITFPESLVELSARTLEQHYSRRWKKELELDPDNLEGPHYPWNRCKWTENEKRTFLAHFPASALPASLATYRSSFKIPTSR
jgi:hypothetical protein